MKLVGICGAALVLTLVAACGSGDPPESIHGNPGGPGSVPGVGGTGGGPVTGGSGGFAGGGPTKGGPPGDVGFYSEPLVEEAAPPPIAGGTLAIIARGSKAAVADPDHDQVVVIDLTNLTVSATIPLAVGDDPGRLVEDAAGRLHVALRAGRGVAVVDPKAGVMLGRLPVCPLPRGLAYDADSDNIYVACAGGELVSYTASSGDLVRRLRLERDLRDVVVEGERLYVSRFRSAELLVVENDGTVSAKLVPPHGAVTPMKPAVAWRTVAAPGGGAIMVHQLVDSSPINVSQGGYGGGCRQIVTTAVSQLRLTHTGWSVEAVPAVLPVDVATTADGKMLVVPSAGWATGATFKTTAPFTVFGAPAEGTHTLLAPCLASGPNTPPPTLPGGTPQPTGKVTAVAFDPAGRLALQTREPAMFHLGDRSVALPGRSRKHTGHELFHLATTAGIACASCHPEGREDGQVWNFAQLGTRRTQSLAGGIGGTEPFHWSGDMVDFDHLAADVFGSRMSGPRMEQVYTRSLFNWVDKIPRLEAPAAADPEAAARGQAVFNDASVGCANCHAGARMSNNANVFVNTGGSFQVPSLLGIAWRAPYMHSGCAATLNERFISAACGGGEDHGHTTQLTANQRADLVTYLETL
jgi:mono/diheme cytochrome c family protein